MPALRRSHDLRTLASIARGERLRIERIVFDTVRAQAQRAGLVEGDVVTGCAATSAHLVLDGPQGTVLFEREWARFVEVSVTGTVAPSARACA